MHLTSTARTARHRKRQADKIERYEEALEQIEKAGDSWSRFKATRALNPTDPAKS